MCRNESASDERAGRQKNCAEDDVRGCSRVTCVCDGIESTREDVTLVDGGGGVWIYVCRLVSKLVVLRGQIRCTMKK